MATPDPTWPEVRPPRTEPEVVPAAQAVGQLVVRPPRTEPGVPVRPTADQLRMADEAITEVRRTLEGRIEELTSTLGYHRRKREEARALIEAADEGEHYAKQQLREFRRLLDLTPLTRREERVAAIVERSAGDGS